MKKKSKYYYYGEPENERMRSVQEKRARPVQEKRARPVSKDAKKQGVFSRLFGSGNQGAKEKGLRPAVNDGLDKRYMKSQDESGQLKKELESKISNAKDTGELLAVFKEIIAELRKENEELRRDRQFFLGHMKDIILTESASRAEEGASEEEEGYFQEVKPEKEKKPEKMESAERQSGRRIETSLDSLLDMIMKKGSVKVSDAARQLKVREKQIEEWAHVLEEHDIIEIHYPTMGKPLLKKKV